MGKTTTIGKLAGKFREQHKRVILAAADTFRAAAGEQLKEWANRAEVEMIGGQEGEIRLLLYLMQWQQRAQEKRIFYCAIQQDAFTIKRT